MDMAKLMRALLRNVPVYFKMGGLLFLMLILLIPINMIDNQIGERRYRQIEVETQIGKVWGAEQNHSGPVLILPYRKPVKTTHADGSVSITSSEGRLFTLPESLSITARLDPEVRYRGIFEAIVYRGVARYQGVFAKPDPAAAGLEDAEILWDRAILATGVSDMRGTGGALEVRFGQVETGFSPGTTSAVMGSGLHARVGEALRRGWPRDTVVAFDFSIDFAGSKRLSFVPSGKQTRVTVNSDWQHPRFEGAWLPTERSIGAGGFQAHWSISHFGRGFPQLWDEQNVREDRLAADIDKTRFGVSLISPVDFYLKSERSIKYAMLFVLLIFATVFVLEIAVPVRVHLFQYMLVGFAMTIFYLLLLALSEVVGFASAYMVAALTATAMISLYLGKVMRNLSRAAMVAAILALVYGFLYVVLQLEEYALLTGSLGVAAALAAVMYATRNIDWYRLTHAEPEEGGDRKSPPAAQP